ncbi:hypothetical protein [Arthrobacter sp. ISL-28]|uniref:hypothetical protein n=1 Tax=Arthrobacter sp. ISL-28 TaxID=2819108 RepID=UPI001BEA5D79|nr:hypothetical protein [Arthrobacter sp. ISL-28]MBT2521810.1 hypothetical protein [Arthrobacter sp. ISL-28]
MTPKDRLANISAALTAFGAMSAQAPRPDINGVSLALAQLGEHTKKVADFKDGSLLASVGAFSDAYISSIERLGIDTKTSLDAPLLALASLPDMSNFYSSAQVGDSLAAIGSAVSSSFGVMDTQELVEQADAFRAEVDASDVDDRASELFDTHPELADSIEQLPMLVSLSPENRSLVIWFIRIAVTLYVTCIILNISMDNAELAAVIGAVGISGPTAGGAAAKGAKYLLGKIPPDEGQQQPDRD